MSVDSRPRNLIELSDRWRPYRSLAFASEYDE
jgi:hypothetical protein